MGVFRILTMIAVFGLASAAAAAAAAAQATPPPPGRVGPCDGTYASLSGLTDYRFDGISESNREPTWQVTAYCYRNSGVFVGTQVTGIDFQDRPRTPVEVDLYLGRQVRWRGTSVTLDLLYSAFPSKRAPGPSYNVVEPQVEVSRTMGRLTLNGTAGWEGEVSGHGQEWRLRTGAAVALESWVSVGGHFGSFIGSSGADHNHSFYDIGATAMWRRLSFDLHYGGTNLPRFECY
jgi:uncharacterized protein (TIGR02001 family)